MIGIIDYGMGNIHSVQKALLSMHGRGIIISRPSQIKLCKKLVLPGVGAFCDAMLELKKRKLIAAIIQAIENKKTFLGICLGMQLLFEKSEEAKNTLGLGLLKGTVKKFKGAGGLKVPQMGWNQLKKVTKSQSHKVTRECPLLKGVPDNSYVYFCHSYYVAPADKEIISATTAYGVNFASVIRKDNIYGVQFHPEKSQDVGLKILKNFVNL